MARELKFRVWFEPSDKYKREQLKLCGKMPEDIYSISYTSDDLFDDTWCNLANYKHKPVIEQYTGLKDKNGKEIYEGDIVKFDNYLFKVVWRNFDSSFILENDEDEMAFLLMDDCKRYDIIGNINENPDFAFRR